MEPKKRSCEKVSPNIFTHKISVGIRNELGKFFTFETNQHITNSENKKRLTMDMYNIWNDKGEMQDNNTIDKQFSEENNKIQVAGSVTKDCITEETE